MTKRGAEPTGDAWITSIGLFVVALAARLLFLYAGPDSAWPYSLNYKGDALVWLQSVLAHRAGQPFEAGIPLRPPGMTWLVDWLWDGTPAGVQRLKLVWAGMGALGVLLLHRALLYPFGRRVAGLAGGLACLATGGLVLSTSICNESPYLLVVLSTFVILPRIRERATPGWLTLFGGLHALATLLRVEHVLFFALASTCMALRWRRDAGGRLAFRSTLTVGAVFVLCLLPWHLSMWAAIERLNTGQQSRDPVSERALAAVEARTDHIVWQPAARTAVQSLPAFLQRSACTFITATVQHRGGGVVGPEDAAIVEEAFGSWPEPLDAHPFVASYGPLNFYLANNALATPGFSRAGLERAPALAGGAQRYPADLVGGMPPRRLSLEYPPHLAIFNHGYALGLRWIIEAPGDWARLVAAKLRIFWAGASLGYTGNGLPVGPSGVRRSVDMVVPQGTLSSLWRWLNLIVCTAGVLAVLSGRERVPSWKGADLLPWMLYGGSKLVIAATFFGYARQGALILPVVHTLWALAIVRWVVPSLRVHALRLGLALLAAGLGFEVWRAAVGVHARIDGVPVLEQDPVPVDVHAQRDVRFGSGRTVAGPR